MHPDLDTHQAVSHQVQAYMTAGLRMICSQDSQAAQQTPLLQVECMAHTVMKQATFWIWADGIQAHLAVKGQTQRDQVGQVWMPQVTGVALNITGVTLTPCHVSASAQAFAYCNGLCSLGLATLS
jgi:hypothetical protein